MAVIESHLPAMPPCEIKLQAAIRNAMLTAIRSIVAGAALAGILISGAATAQQ